MLKLELFFVWVYDGGVVGEKVGKKRGRLTNIKEGVGDIFMFC